MDITVQSKLIHHLYALARNLLEAVDGWDYKFPWRLRAYHIVGCGMWDAKNFFF